MFDIGKLSKISVGGDATALDSPNPGVWRGDRTRTLPFPDLQPLPPDRAVRSAAALTVVVPTYSERDNIAELVRRLTSVLRDVDWEVVFVDDDSPDGIGSARCNTCASTIPAGTVRTTVVRHEAL